MNFKKSKTNLQLREQSRHCTEFPFNFNIVLLKTKIGVKIGLILERKVYFENDV